MILRNLILKILKTFFSTYQRSIDAITLDAILLLLSWLKTHSSVPVKPLWDMIFLCDGPENVKCVWVCVICVCVCVCECVYPYL